MKKKISSKKCIAVILAAIMVITSVPFMLVSALTTGAYDPAPYWGTAGDEYGAINTNFIATLGTDGSVSISFPNANAQKTYDGSANKSIAKYVFTLTKLSEDGSRKEIYSEVFDASAVATGDASAKYPNNIYYGPGGLESLPDYDVQSTYDVAIHAIDSDGWFSDKIHTLLSDVPYYEMSTDFSPNETWVAREMLLFEAAGSADAYGQDQSSNGAAGSMPSELSSDQSEIDYLYNVNGLLKADGQMSEMGYDNSSAYRFWIENAYTGTSFTFDTTWSRSHYNFENAEEAWFYVDFSRVDFAQVAFSLTANEKRYVHWKSGSEDKTWSRYGDVFSTKAVNDVNTGVKDGVYIQNDDGLWEETTMTNGYLTDLAGYKGFVRIPIDYFVLQTDQYINARNTVSTDWTKSESGITDYANSLLFRQDSSSGIILELEDGTQRTSTAVTKTFDIDDSTENKDVYQVLVNPKGTSVTDALIIYDRFEKFEEFSWSSFKTVEYTRGTGKQLHTGTTVTETTNTDGTITYKVTDGVKAIEDLCSAGFEVAGWSEDSIHKSFYIDQVMFCQFAEGATFNDDGSVATTSAVQFPDEGGDFAGDLGKKVAGYYDRTVEVPKAVANYITEYVGEIPSLEDVNALEMIDSIIETYINCFPGCTTVEQAIAYLNTAGHTEAYNRYTAAVNFIESYINLGDSTRNYNAVVAFESGVELLPDPEFADYNDEALKTRLEELMALYKSFNLSHFEILGADAEEKFTTLYDIMMGEEVKTGYSIGGYPYIPFNDFETNYSYGQLSQLYYDDYPARVDSMSTDVNNTKNFVTWVHNDATSHVNSVSGIGRGWSPMVFNPSANDGSFESDAYFGRMDAIISNEGFSDSLGATLRLHGELNALTGWKLATLSTTYLGQNVNNWSELNGLDLSALAVSTAIDTDTESTQTFDEQNVTRYGTGVLPNSFVMYVDFTDVQDICMSIGFVLEKSDGTDVECYFNGGATDKTPVIYLLDEKGEWVEEHLAVTTTDTDAASSLLNREVAASICTISPSAENRLEGYKGFIRIPLTNFRITDLKNKVVEYTCEDYLVLDDELDTHTIKQAKVTFWDETGANVGKEIHVDAMGFTYDPSCQTRVVGTTADAVSTKLNTDNGITVKNMDEYFGVKTNDSVEVEKMIAEIDPYVGETQFIADCNAVLEAYAKLSPYQKALEEIDYAYNTLFYNKYYDLYVDYNTVINQEPWIAKYATATELSADIATLDANATGFDITDADNALTMPYDMATGTIDYSQLGIADKAAAEAIVEMYEKGYMRLSGTEKGNLSADDLTKLENAYNAAKRLLLLEDYLADITTFKNEIVQIYTPGTKESDVRMVSYNNNQLLTAIESYESMSVFAKKMVNETTTDEYVNYKYGKMYEAAEAIYDNSHTITMSNGTPIDGGVLVFEDRMLTCATDVASKIESRTVLDTTILNEIEYCLGQTESFLPRYAQVDEINVAYHELADLLPFAEITNATTQVLLTNATDAAVYSYTTDVDLSYVAARLNRTVSVYLVTDYKWTQTTGTTYDFGYYTVNGATGTDGTVVYTKLGDYANGATAEFNPVISVDETAAKNVPTGAQYSGTVKLMIFDSTLITDGVDVSTLTPLVEPIEIPVVFSSVNGADPMVYTVTIPAIVQVDWDDSSEQDVSYSVEATLGSNELSVGVQGDGTNTLVADNTDKTLTYTETNFKTTTFTGTVAAGTKPTDEPSIAVSGWDAVPVGEYSTQLTYTVGVTSS